MSFIPGKYFFSRSLKLLQFGIALWSLNIYSAQGQSFVNGDFENNSAVGDQINLSNAGYNALMANSFSFGTLGDMDIITSTTYGGGPESGNWFVAFTGSGTDMISMDLTAPLVIGNNYTISFYDRGDVGYTPFPFQIGVSTVNNAFGTMVYTAPTAASYGAWTLRTFTFTAPIAATYVTVKMSCGNQGDWSQTDNFQIIPTNNPPTDGFLGPDTSLCSSPLILNAGHPGATYLWSTGATTQTISVSSTNTYAVTATTNGCAVSDSINVTFLSPFTISLGNDTTLCNGQSWTLNATTPNATYLWQNGATTGTITANTSGLYWVNVTAGGCTVSDSVNITFNNCGTSPANFTLPDTVCVGETVNIQNTTIGGTTFNWSFDYTTLNSAVTNTTVGNPGGLLATPTFSDVAFDGTNYYMFISNYFVAQLVRWDFGNSLLNIPTATNLGNFGGILPPELEGVQIENDGGTWYGFVVGGGNNVGLSKIVRLNFGASLSNVPTATNLGNISNTMNWPHQLEIFKEGFTWYGATVNRGNNSMTIFDFGNSLANTPTATNTVAGLGGMSEPINFALLKDYMSNTWYGFVSNPVNSNLTFLTFGASITNPPIGINIGNPGNLLNGPRAILLTTDCDEVVGYVANENGANIIKLSFAGGLQGAITATNLGTFGGVLNNTHYMAPCWINGNFDVMTTNAGNSTVQRLQLFTSPVVPIPPSNLQTPPAYSYNAPGTYHVQLLVDEGMATQSFMCKDITAVQLNFVNLGPDTTICSNQTLTLDAGNPGATYVWSNAQTTQTINVSFPGTYWVIATLGGCSSSDSVTVSTVPPPVVNLGNDTTLCTGQSLVLNSGNPVNTHLWSTGAVTQSITVTTSGTYWVNVTNIGCTVSDTINVTFVPGNYLNLGNDTTVCSGFSVLLDAGSPGSIYNWSTSATTQTISVSTSGVYSVTVSDNGCLDTDTITVSTIQSPSVDLGNDTTLCTGDFLTVDAGNPGMIYNWSNTLTTQQILVNSAGTYAVTITNSNGCPASDSIVVSYVNPPVVNIGNDTVLCVGQTIVLDAGNPGASYNWNTGETDESITVSYPDNNYWVEVTSGVCMMVDYLFITYNVPPVISLPNDTSICEGQTFTLSPGVGIGWTYQWSTSDQTPSIDVTSPGTYSVTVTDPNSCTISDEIVVDNNCIAPIFIPQAFTPNHDGLNEILFVRSHDIQTFLFIVYDRWGNKMFETTDLNEGWDGTYRGMDMGAGVYVYYIKAIFTSGDTREQKGDVTLIR